MVVGQGVRLEEKQVKVTIRGFEQSITLESM